MDLRTSLLIGAILAIGLVHANPSNKTESPSEALNSTEVTMFSSFGSNLFSFASQFLLVKKHPVTDKKHPVTDKKHPVTDKKHPVTDNKHPVTDKKYPITDKKHLVIDKKHSVTDKISPVLGSKSPDLDKKSSDLDENSLVQENTVTDKKTTPAADIKYLLTDKQVLPSEKSLSSHNEETELESHENQPRAPRINIEIDPNDFENNEIEGSTKKKPIKVIEEVKEESNDWISYVLKFFGYKSFGDLVKNVDIFSLPQAIQNATRTYKEEIGLGQCYMEFTTFTVFSPEDSVFYNNSFFRSKRDATDQTPEELVEESRATDSNGQANMINNLANTVISMLQRSPATAKYGTTIKQLLPMVMEVIGNDNPQQAMIQFATKNLLPLISGLASGGGSSNNVNKEKIKYQNQFASLGQNSVHSPSSSSTSSAISPLLDMATKFFLGGANRKPSPAKRPDLVKKTQIITKAQEKVDKKTSFAKTILDFIKPMFISIVGSAPGDNGVQTLRDVSKLSTLSRVDDELLNVVKSPFFCAKNYMINKAWSLTEGGVDYMVGYIDSAQQERMARMMSDYAPFEELSF